jgi:hypothetical protein
MSLSALRHPRLVRGLTSFRRTPEDFDHRPCSRAPELEFVSRLAISHSDFNIIEMLPNHVHRAITMSIDQASSGNPGDPVHDEKVRAESLRQVKLTTCAAHTPTRFFGVIRLAAPIVTYNSGQVWTGSVVMGLYPIGERLASG